jgi:predicted DNA-binding transcriptional regulator AlpA
METLSRLNSSRIAAQRLRMSERNLERLRASGTGPKFVRVGRLVSYTDRDLEEYIASQTVQSTSEARS